MKSINPETLSNFQDNVYYKNVYGREFNSIYNEYQQKDNNYQQQTMSNDIQNNSVQSKFKLNGEFIEQDNIDSQTKYCNVMKMLNEYRLKKQTKTNSNSVTKYQQNVQQDKLTNDIQNKSPPRNSKLVEQKYQLNEQDKSYILQRLNALSPKSSQKAYVYSQYDQQKQEQIQPELLPIVEEEQTKIEDTPQFNTRFESFSMLQNQLEEKENSQMQPKQVFLNLSNEIQKNPKKSLDQFQQHIEQIAFQEEQIIKQLQNYDKQYIELKKQKSNIDRGKVEQIKKIQKNHIKDASMECQQQQQGQQTVENVSKQGKGLIPPYITQLRQKNQDIMQRSFGSEMLQQSNNSNNRLGNRPDSAIPKLFLSTQSFKNEQSNNNNNNKTQTPSKIDQEQIDSSEVTSTMNVAKASYNSLKQSSDYRKQQVFGNNSDQYIIVNKQEFNRNNSNLEKKDKLFDYLQLFQDQEEISTDFVESGIWRNLSVLERNELWLNAKNQKLKEQQSKIYNKDLDNCTFKPSQFTKSHSFFGSKTPNNINNSTQNNFVLENIIHQQQQQQQQYISPKQFNKINNNNNSTLSSLNKLLNDESTNGGLMRSASKDKRDLSYQQQYKDKKQYSIAIEELYSHKTKTNTLSPPFSQFNSFKNTLERNGYQNKLKSPQSLSNLKSTVKISDVVKMKV